MNTAPNHSLKVIQSFVNSLSCNQIPAIVMSEVLDISVDIAYRRLNGKVPLTLDETVKLCQYAGLSLDDAIPLQEENVRFYRMSFSDTVSVKYLEELIALIKLQIRHCGTGLFGASANFPIGSLFSQPRLMAFKLYHLENDKFSFANIKPFSLNNLPSNYKACLHYFKELSEIYDKLDTNEFWCKATFSAFLGEIKNYKQLGLLSPEDEQILLEDFERLLCTFERFAAEGKKNNMGNFYLYIVPYNITNSMYLSFSSENMISYMEMNLLDFAYTRNEKYCKKQQKWFEMLMNYSVCISKSNIKERKAFFKELLNALNV